MGNSQQVKNKKKKRDYRPVHDHATPPPPPAGCSWRPQLKNYCCIMYKGTCAQTQTGAHTNTSLKSPNPKCGNFRKTNDLSLNFLVELSSCRQIAPLLAKFKQLLSSNFFH